MQGLDPEKPKKLLSSLTDEELIKQYKKDGDKQYVGELFTRYRHLAYGVCLKYLESRERSKDAVMQIFEKLFDTLLEKEIQTFPSWLHVVSRNHCLMELRHQKRILRSEGIAEQWEFMENDEGWHPLIKSDDFAQDEEAVQRCLKTLKSMQRECIERFYLQKQSYKQISLDLGESLKKVKSYIQNGKRNLGICIKKKREERE